MMQYVRFIALCFLEDKFRFCVKGKRNRKDCEGYNGRIPGRDEIRPDEESGPVG